MFIRRRQLAECSPLQVEKNRVGTHADVAGAVIDVEASNRCNATCEFCPRHLTPHQGHMTPRTFGKVLERALEFRALVQDLRAGLLDFSFCGLGEGLLNPDLPAYMSRASDAGFKPGLCSNAHLLDRRRAATLLDAGLADVFLNVGEIGDQYDAIYGLPFAEAQRNVDDFMELARGRCNVWIVVVDHRMDPEHVARIEHYWRARGVHMFFPSPMLNRAGAQLDERLDFRQHGREAEARQLFNGEIPGCVAPRKCITIGYDGRYYICNSDWRKEESAGTVFELSVIEAIDDHFRRSCDRENAICRRCNHDPLNQVSRLLDSGADPALTGHAVAIARERQVHVERFLGAARRGGHLSTAPGPEIIPARQAR